MRRDQRQRQIGLIDESAECLKIAADVWACHAPMIARRKRLLFLRKNTINAGLGQYLMDPVVEAGRLFYGSPDPFRKRSVAAGSKRPHMSDGTERLPDIRESRNAVSTIGFPTS